MRSVQLLDCPPHPAGIELRYKDYIVGDRSRPRPKLLERDTLCSPTAFMGRWAPLDFLFLTSAAGLSRSHVGGDAARTARSGAPGRGPWAARPRLAGGQQRSVVPFCSSNVPKQMSFQGDIFELLCLNPHQFKFISMIDPEAVAFAVSTMPSEEAVPAAADAAALVEVVIPFGGEGIAADAIATPAAAAALVEAAGAASPSAAAPATAQTAAADAPGDVVGAETGAEPLAAAGAGFGAEAGPEALAATGNGAGAPEIGARGEALAGASLPGSKRKRASVDYAAVNEGPRIPHSRDFVFFGGARPAAAKKEKKGAATATTSTTAATAASAMTTKMSTSNTTKKKKKAPAASGGGFGDAASAAASEPGAPKPKKAKAPAKGVAKVTAKETAGAAEGGAKAAPKGTDGGAAKKGGGSEKGGAPASGAAKKGGGSEKGGAPASKKWPAPELTSKSAPKGKEKEKDTEKGKEMAVGGSGSGVTWRTRKSAHRWMGLRGARVFGSGDVVEGAVVGCEAHTG